MITKHIAEIAAVVVACAVAIPAQADFNPATGLVELEGPNVTSFDDGATVTALGDLEFLAPTLATVPAAMATYVPDGIEGQGALRLDQNVGGISISLDRLDATMRGRRIEIRFWYQPDGTTPFAELYYLGVGGDAILGNREAPFAALGVVRFWPTGRATDDGWVEMSSGAVDYALHDQVEAQLLRIVDERALATTYFGDPPPTDGGVLIDALQVIDVSERAVPDAACSLATEVATCGSQGVCFYGRCADAAIAEGSLPANDRIRAEYFDRQVERIRLFAGSRYIAANFEAFKARIDAAKDEPLPRMWSEYRRAHDDLADGHLSTPYAVYVLPIGRPACLYESEADLLPGAPIRPMVHQVRRGHPLAAQIQTGDVLVAIDGETVEQWTARSDRRIRYGGDPRGRSFITAPWLIEAILWAGSSMTFQRCEPSAPDVACTAAEVETIEVDVTPLLAETFTGSRGRQWFETMNCDFRFSQPVVGPPQDRDFVGHVDEGDVRTILINGVSGNRTWMQRVRAALDGVPAKVILDERTGGGGTFEGVSALLSPFLANTENPLALVLPKMSPEVDAQSRDQLIRCSDLGGQVCGNSYYLPLATSVAPGSFQPNARIAILNGLDVSGNDFLPHALSNRSTGATRIFGAVPTYGAFGPLWQMPRLGNEILGGSFQVQDTVFLDGDGDPNLMFTTGTGVEPDEVIYQKQSDALLGVDTLMTRARAWLEETP